VHFVGLFLSSLLKMHGPKNKIERDQNWSSLHYYYRYSALGLVSAETRAQSGDWYSSGKLHPGQVLRGSLPLLSPLSLHSRIKFVCYLKHLFGVRWWSLILFNSSHWTGTSPPVALEAWNRSCFCLKILEILDIVHNSSHWFF